MEWSKFPKDIFVLSLLMLKIGYNILKFQKLSTYTNKGLLWYNQKINIYFVLKDMKILCIDMNWIFIMVKFLKLKSVEGFWWWGGVGGGSERRFQSRRLFRFITTFKPFTFDRWITFFNLWFFSFSFSYLFILYFAYTFSCMEGGRSTKILTIQKKWSFTYSGTACMNSYILYSTCLS